MEPCKNLRGESGIPIHQSLLPTAVRESAPDPGSSGLIRPGGQGRQCRKAAASGAIPAASLEGVLRQRTAPYEFGGDPARRAVLVRDTRPGDEAVDSAARRACVGGGPAAGALVVGPLDGPATGVAPALPGALALHLRAASQQLYDHNQPDDRDAHAPPRSGASSHGSHGVWAVPRSRVHRRISACRTAGAGFLLPLRGHCWKTGRLLSAMKAPDFMGLPPMARSRSGK